MNILKILLTSKKENKMRSSKDNNYSKYSKIYSNLVK